MRTLMLEREDKLREPAAVNTMCVEIDGDLCVGSGICVELCPEIFELTNNVARAKIREVPARYRPACIEAVRQCPMDAIKVQT